MSNDNPSGWGWGDPSGPPPPPYPPPPPPGYGWAHGGPSWGPPQAPKPGIIPLRPLGLGELLDGGFALIRRYPRATLGLAAAVMFVVEAVQLFATYLLTRDGGIASASFSTDGGDTINGDALARTFTLDGLILVVTLVATVVLTGMLTAVVGPAVLGKAVTASDAWHEVRAVAGRLFGATASVFLIAAGAVLACTAPGLVILGVGAATGGGLVVAGAVLAVIGGIGGFVLAIYLNTSLAFSAQVVVLEKVPVRVALRRSRTLVKGSWWRIFGITLLASIIAQVVAGAIGLPFTIAGAFREFSSFSSDQQTVSVTFTDLLLSGIGGLLGSTIARPFASGVAALLYIDQRMRREALDLTLQQAAASQAP